MFVHRTPRRRLLGVALIAVALSGAPSVVAAAVSWRPTLLHQSPVADFSAHASAALSFSLAVGEAHTGADAAQVSIYSVLHTRSALAPIIDGHGAPGLPVSSTGRFPLTCITRGVASFVVTLGERAGDGAPSCGAHPFIHLACDGASCDGVYPLAVTTTDGSTNNTIWSLVSVITSHDVTPVNVAYVVSTNPSDDEQAASETAALRTIAGASSVPLTVAVTYTGLDHVSFASSAANTAYRGALAAAIAPANHQVINEPPADIDYASLLHHHLLGDVATQAREATSLLSRFSHKAPSGVVALTGTPSVADLTALGQVGVHNVIIPDSDVTTPPSGTLKWGTPFYVAGSPSDQVAVATDTPLGALAQNTSISPGLRATLIAGELAMLHFQAPYAPAPRTAVVTIALERVGSRFLSDLLSEMRANRLITPVAVGGLFSMSEIGANHYPTIRNVVTTAVAPWSNANVAVARTLSTSLSSYGESVASLTPATPLQIEALVAERRQAPGARQDEFSSVENRFGNVLAGFHIDDTSINLAGTGTQLPITITTTAPYSVSGWVSLSAPDVTFPEGNDIDITLDASTESIRVPADIHGSGNFTLGVKFLSLDRHLVIASGLIQVHSATTSAVGYVLSGGALLTIALWWWRTSRRRTTARHAR